MKYILLSILLGLQPAFAETMTPSSMIEKYEGVSTDQIELLTYDEKNNLYDELITYMKVNKIRDNIEYYTKYQLEDDINKRAEKKKSHTFEHLIKKINPLTYPKYRDMGLLRELWSLNLYFVPCLL